MPSLPELQRAFGAALLERGREPALASLVSPAPADRLAVYRGNVVGNQRNALTGAYPIVRKIVGEEFFSMLARAYSRAHPSASGDLREFGARLAEFLETYPPAGRLPYLPDVARLEWLAHRAYYAADAAPFEPARLVGVPPERVAELRLALAPACALLESPWPLARLWEIHQDDYAGEFEVDLGAGPNRVLVHRPLWRVEVCSLAPGDYRLLEAALDSAALGHALAAAQAADPGFDPGAALARWVDAGVVVDLR